jgi:hypothetical protein
MSIGATGARSASTGTIEEYCEHTPIDRTAGSATSATASSTAPQRASASCSATSPSRWVRSGRSLEASKRPSASTRAAFTLLDPMSIPIAGPSL